MALSVRKTLPSHIRDKPAQWRNHIRHSFFFEPATSFRDQLKDQLSSAPIWPGPSASEVRMVPWIVEAPLNSVEVLEEILKPSKPFVVRTARHYPRQCRTRWPTEGTLRMFQRRYREFLQYEGRLTQDREVSFVCIPENAAESLRERLLGTGFTTARLHYISIPWSRRSDRADLDLVHPWGLMLFGESHPGSEHTYETCLNHLLSNLRLDDCKFERSLLQLGAMPTPECQWDWVAGVPGRTAALPYYIPEYKVDDKEEGESTGVQGESTQVEVKVESHSEASSLEQ